MYELKNLAVECKLFENGEYTNNIIWQKCQSKLKNTWDNLSSKLSDKMYNVSVCPSKIVAKTRRGISQNLESFQNFRKPIDFGDGEIMNNPRPVFYTNGKKCSFSHKQQEIISPQHEELIKYVSEAWSEIYKELETDGLEDSEAFTPNNSTSIIYYKGTEPNVFLQNFKPFDLESWWGKRLFNNITKSVP